MTSHAGCSMTAQDVDAKKVRSAGRAWDANFVSKCEWMSIDHLDYPEVEFEFQSREVDRFARQAQRTWADLLADVREITGLLDGARPLGVVVSRAIETIGLAALRPERWEGVGGGLGPEELRLELAWVRGRIWGRIEHLRECARRGRTKDERQKAAEQLRAVGAALAGDRRGLRASAVTNPILVHLVYRQSLFRLLRVQSLLKVWPWGGSVTRRVQDVSRVCGVPEDRLRDYLRLDEEGAPRGRPLTAQATARIWTARHFNITEQTVANVLSGRPAAGYRK